PYVLLGTLDSGQTLSMLATDAASKTNFGAASAYSMVRFAYICLVAFLFGRLLGADVIGDQNRPAKKRRAPRRLRTTAEGSMPRAPPPPRASSPARERCSSPGSARAAPWDRSSSAWAWRSSWCTASRRSTG